MGKSPLPVIGDGDGKNGANSFLRGSSRRSNDEEILTDELKVSGMSVLLHVRVGKLEPASIKLDEETGALVIKTDREGWCSWCNCFSKRYEIGPAQLEPTDTRTCTSKLTRSISLVNSGDAYLVERMLQRSLSLLRRHPEPDSIDLTFSTQDEQERFRLWVQARLSVGPEYTRRASSRSIVKALEGFTPSDDSDDETAYSEDQPTPKNPLKHAVTGSVFVRSIQRKQSLKQRRSQSEGWERHRALSSGSSRGQDVSVIPETAVVTSRSGSGGGGGVGGGSAFDESLKAMWSWKEPPVLRKVGSSSSLPYVKSRSFRGSGGSTLTVDKPTPGGYSLDGNPSRRGSEPPLPSSVSLDSAVHHRGNSAPGSEIGADFWDPLGLMSDVVSATPPARKHVPERGSRRDISLVSDKNVDSAGTIDADNPLSVGGAEKGGKGAVAAAAVPLSPQESLGTSRHSTNETKGPTGLPEVSE